MAVLFLQRYSDLVESLVILTAADGALTHTTRRVVELVRAFEVPVVFISDRSSAEMLQLQYELDVRHPFIPEGGAHLYIPHGYFPEVLDTEPDEDDWQVLHLRARGGDAGDAVRLLMALYRSGDDPVLFVGMGEDWKDRALLRAVDVPVIVRNDGIDQLRLLRSIPEAYLTTASGVDGWKEAILGSAGE